MATASSLRAKPGAKEDVWISTACNMCFCACSIKVHRVDGVVVKIEGNPDSPIGEGRVCAKGASGMNLLYDPRRITKPMKRTNPKKGIDQDPGWQEISWDEAYDMLAGRMKAHIEAGEPWKIAFYSMVASMPSLMMNYFYLGALGCTDFNSDICGASIHFIYEALTGTGNARPDYENSKLVLQFGVQAGTATRHAFNMTVRRFADSRVDRGCRLINVDPRMSAGAEKADIWVPIRPGTDGAMALAIAYVLVHELDLIDRDFLTAKTNSPYLVDPVSGRFLTEPETQKPLVWDSADRSVKPFDSPNLVSPALEGRFTVADRTYLTAFQAYTENLRKYSPEWAEPITTIKAFQIRSIAREFGETAGIGQTTVIGGKAYPYRPVAADCFSGVTRHKLGFHQILSVLQLNTLVGALNVPGGLIGFSPKSLGYKDHPQTAYGPGLWEQQGLTTFSNMMYGFPGNHYAPAYENEYRHDPHQRGMKGLIPFGADPMFAWMTQLQPERWKIEPAETFICYGGNPYRNWGNHAEMAEILKTFRFMVSVDHYLNDSSYFADLFIPEATYLERFESPPNGMMNHHTIGGVGTDWAYAVRQPVVPSRDGAPGWTDVLHELAYRTGTAPVLLGTWNAVFSLTPEHQLDPMGKYTFPEVLDRLYKSWFGNEHGLEWFKKNGVLTWPRKPEEVYIYPDHPGKVPLYHEYLVMARDKVAKAAAEAGVEWDVHTYTAFPTLEPCVDFSSPAAGYDLYVTYYTNAFNVDSWGHLNPWLSEINDGEPYGYNIEINTATARSLGLESGDDVTLVGLNGAEVPGRLLLVEGLHPEVVAVGGGCWGLESKYVGAARHRGSAVNDLIPVIAPERYDPIGANYDQCVRVKVEKRKGALA